MTQSDTAQDPIVAKPASTDSARDIRKKRKLHKPSTAQILVLGYLGVILLGTFLLCLPISNREGVWTGFLDALLTATSATCVTGLITLDTYIYWNTFGIIVIILLIQVGGLGFMTFITLFSFALGRRIGLFERSLLVQSAGAFNKGGIVRLIKRILIFTFSVEAVGAALLCIPFCRDFGGVGVGMALFHSVAAFCNAGFDIMGIAGTPFASLTAYSGDTVVNLTICGLILMGGMGYVVWSDIWDKRFRYKHFRLHTRIVLWATLILVAVPTLLIFVFEHNTPILEGKNGWERFLICLFQAVTPRTAGFNTVSVAGLSDSTKLLTMILMFIGGNSGSTAGGIKVTTLVVIIFALYSSMRNQKDIVISKRSLDLSLAKQAMSLLTIYLALVLSATMIICALESFPLTDVVFECISALGTVGLTTGITPFLSGGSKFIITLLMFSGRLGVMTLATAMMESKVKPLAKRPSEKILIG